MRPLSKDDANRVKLDAMQGINALQAIAYECDGLFSFPSYIKEKADKASRCLEFIQGICEEYMEKEEEAQK